MPSAETLRTSRPQHPDLSFACSRRRFLPLLVREALVAAGMLRGRPGFRLADLGSLSDEQLATIRPVINPAVEILAEEDMVFARYRQTGATVALFALEEATMLTAFNLFDGRHTLVEVGEHLVEAADGASGPGAGFSLARDLFLCLAGKLVCVPKDPLEPI